MQSSLMLGTKSYNGELDEILGLKSGICGILIKLNMRGLSTLLRSLLMFQ